MTIRDLRAGDYIPDAAATVSEVECFASVAIVTFTDGTATAPIPADAPVRIAPRDTPPVALLAGAGAMLTALTWATVNTFPF